LLTFLGEAAGFSLANNLFIRKAWEFLQLRPRCRKESHWKNSLIMNRWRSGFWKMQVGEVVSVPHAAKRKKENSALAQNFG
jgi:hypothetical protein